LAKAYLNSLLSQPAGKSSMIDLPLAMTREAVMHVGSEHLLVPPLAYARAAEKQLRVERIGRTKPERTASARQRHKNLLDQKQRDIVHLGDHLEAIRYVASSPAMSPINRRE
jgi:hypothetical protein